MKLRLFFILCQLLWASVALPQNCTTATPCSLFGTTAPAGSAGAGAQDERGMHFTSDTAGTIVGIKFYKVTGDTAATHKVNLWDNSCVKLGSAYTTTETASGWQTATFATPVPISSNTTYIASYGTSSLITPINRYFFTSSAGTPTPTNTPPLHAPAVNGTIAFDAIGQCANATAYQFTNYWVDVLFVSTTLAPPAITMQPQSISVTVGNSAAFAVTASGQNLTYQWSKNGTAIAGATLPNYMQKRTSQSDNGASFTVAISNAAGSVTSTPAILTVTPIETTAIDAGFTSVSTWNAALGALMSCSTSIACTAAIGMNTSGALVFTITIPTSLSISSVSPGSGPVGTVITITGTGFMQGATVTFSNASTAATPGIVTFISSTQLTVVSPQLPAGTYNETLCIPTTPQTCVTHTE
ncbi:MAG TPA: DUF4082 domain-containing protein [Candidatus Binatia bacterium]|nr:DUF4082 domain-containing protein [Candidatus Binatia bacterium]